MERDFTVDEARAALSAIRSEIAELIAIRGDLTEALHQHRRGDESVPMADLKGLEARLAEILDAFRAGGIEVKGWAPLLLDFPSRRDGEPVLLCWIEGEESLGWYHHADHGFAGRRPL